MSRWRLARSIHAAVFGVFVSAVAEAQVLQIPVKFDFKPAGQPTVPGTIAIDETATFGTKGDFGFSVTPLDARIGDNPAHDVIDRGDDDRPFARGCVRLPSGCEFSCYVLPNQVVRVRVLLAHMPFYWKPGTTKLDSFPTALADLAVEASDGTPLRVVANDIDLRTAHQKGKPTSDVGSYRKVWFTAKADAQGKLRFRFTAAGGSLIPLSALHLYPFVALPITYKRQGATWLTPAAGGSLPGLAEFHAKDFASARRKFLTIADPLTRATALLWLAGWFDRTEEGYLADVELAESFLLDHALATNARAIELRDRIADWKLGELHFSLRNYSFASALPPDGYGYFNPAYPGAVFAVAPGVSGTAPRHLYLAENLYYQVAGTQSLTPIAQHNAGTQPDARFEVFPLAFRAIDRVARLHYAMNSLHGYKAGANVDAASLAGIELYESLWQGFDNAGFRTQEFSDCAELGVMCWVANPSSHVHSENGGVFENFAGTAIPANYFDPAKAWWTPLLAASTPAPPGTQTWASAQRDYLRAYRAGLDWWISRRLIDGQFGGGDGDDAELVALLTAPLEALRQPDDAPTRDAMRTVADRILTGPNVDDGYYTGLPIDVEHSAEFTSYPLRTAFALDGGDPWYLDFALDVSKHLTSPSNPAQAWAGADGSGNLRFHSFHFTSDGPAPLSDPQFADVFVDLPYDGKALLPSFMFLNRAPLPILADSIRSWANSWKDAALAAHPTRPPGLVPASITTGINGPAPASWWLATDSGGIAWDFPNNLQSLGYLYSGAFYSAYRLGGPNAYSYLVPVVVAAKGVLALDAALSAGQPVSGLTTVGATNWALDRLRTSQSFIDDIARVRGALASDPMLRTIDDPWIAGTAPYVDDAFLAAVDDLLSKFGGGYLPYLAETQTGPNPAAGQYARKGKNGLTQGLLYGATWLANYFPLASTHALFTDRVFLFHGLSHNTLHGTFTGEILSSVVPRPVITIETPAAATAPLDVAVLVNDLAVKEGTTNPRLRILLHDFETVPRTIDLRFWDRLPFGRYRVRLGACDPNTDYFASGYTEATFDITRLGARLSLTLPPQSLQLAELEWILPLAPAAGFDLGVSSKASTAQIGGSVATGYSVTTGTRVYNASLVPAPGNTLHLYVSLIDSAGTSVPLDQLGTLEAELPIATNHPALPAVSTYDVPSALVTANMALTSEVVALLAQGHSLRFKYRVIAAGDLDPGNDVATVSVGW